MSAHALTCRRLLATFSDQCCLVQGQRVCKHSVLHSCAHHATAKRVCRRPEPLRAAHMTSDQLEAEVEQAFRDAINEVLPRETLHYLQQTDCSTVK